MMTESSHPKPSASSQAPPRVPSADSALAAWARGDLDGHDALIALLREIETTGVRSTLLWQAPEAEGSGPLAVTTQGESKPDEGAALVCAHANVAGRRTLCRRTERTWSELFPDGGPAGADWIAFEPISTESALVISGAGDDEAARDTALASLPAIARSAGVILAARIQAATTGKTTHTVRNLLASLVANGQYSLALLEEAGDGAPIQRAELEQILEATRNVVHAAEQLGPHVRSLTTMANRRGPT